MEAKGCLAVILAFAIIMCVLFIIPRDREFSFGKFMNMLKALGRRSPPTLTGGHDFNGSYNEAAKAITYIISFPIRWAYYFIQQIITFCQYVAGGVVL